MSLLQGQLSSTSFISGVGDVLTVSSCDSIMCLSRLTTVALSGSFAPPIVYGNPYLHIHWKSDTISDASTGWVALWRTEYSRRFRFFENKLNQDKAAAFCEKLQEHGGGWSLASVVSSREEDVIEKLASDMSHLPIWIGLTDKVFEGVYIWADDNPLLANSYTNWGPDEPDDSGDFQKHDADCVALHLSTSGLKWRTENCKASMAFICSKG